jgi:excinuclease UvrABC nuclease subunit
MQASSDRLVFERAASLRDKLGRLESLREQFVRFRFAVETLSFIYQVPGHGGDDRVYLIRRGRVCGEHPVPTCARSRAALRSAADEVFGSSERTGASVPTHEVDELLLLSSWFRRFPSELARTEKHDCAKRTRRSA